jgi:hypothetical protein
LLTPQIDEIELCEEENSIIAKEERQKASHAAETTHDNVSTKAPASDGKVNDLGMFSRKRKKTAP